MIALGLLVALVVGCGPSNVGRVINTPGEHKVRGEFVRGLEVKPGTNGADRLTIKLKNGSTSPDLDLRQGWFVFVEPANRVWAYYGGNDLELLTFEEKKTTAASVSCVPEMLRSAPPEVLANLPESMKKASAKPAAKP
jgi:hypothetical protein